MKTKNASPARKKMPKKRTPTTRVPVFGAAVDTGRVICVILDSSVEPGYRARR